MLALGGEVIDNGKPPRLKQHDEQTDINSSFIQLQKSITQLHVKGKPTASSSDIRIVYSQTNLNCSSSSERTMAAVLFAFGYLINSVIMNHREEKKRRQLKYVGNPSSAPGSKEKSTEGRHKESESLSHKKEKGESLRAKAARKLHGKEANPSQLGDPISIKAETSDTVPTDDESGATTLRGSEDSGLGGYVDGGGRRASEVSREGDKHGERQTQQTHDHRTRREEALGGGNPSMLGDPISVKAETEQRPMNAEEEDAASESTARSKL
jgi:hypothetical protein